MQRPDRPGQARRRPEDGVICRRQLRRSWAEFPLTRAQDGKADIPDKRRPEGRYTPGLFDPEKKKAA